MPRIIENLQVSAAIFGRVDSVRYGLHLLRPFGIPHSERRIRRLPSFLPLCPSPSL